MFKVPSPICNDRTAFHDDAYGDPDWNDGSKTRSESEEQFAMTCFMLSSNTVRSLPNGTMHEITIFLTSLPTWEPGATSVRRSKARLSAQRIMTSLYNNSMPTSHQSLQTATIARLISYSEAAGPYIVEYLRLPVDGRAYRKMIRRTSGGG